MGRAPCCDKANVKRGPWSPEEDAILKDYIHRHGTGGNWIALPQRAGLKRCGKSCRLRWLNYLRPDIKHGNFTAEEDDIICALYKNIGSRWSIIASELPGRTDNDVKNYWNTKLKKRLMLPAKTNLIINNQLTSTSSSVLSLTKPELTNNYNNFSTYLNHQSMAVQNVDNPQNLISSYPIHHMEVSKLCSISTMNNMSNYSISSSPQEISGPSSVSSSDNLGLNNNYYYPTWSSSDGGDADEFQSLLLDLGFGSSSSSDLFNSFCFQDKPNY